MLAEAIGVMRLLWQGGYQTHRGRFYTVEGARLYTVPDSGVELYVAAGAERIAELAGEKGDGLIAVEPDEEVVQKFDGAGGGDKPKIGMAHGCWAESEDEALDTAYEIWPQSGLKGPLNQDLRLPADFEAAAEVVEKEDLRGAIPLGPDPAPWLEEIQSFVDAGFTHVYIHQIGRDQQGFIEFAERELLPKFQ
jgi:G6PDH family F420-dependent oxidoreductase